MNIKLSPCVDGECCDGWLGGDSSNPSWEEYVAGFRDDLRPYLELWKTWILSQSPIPCADEICNDYHFEFSDGKKLGVSWRAWGDLAQAAVGKREGYMTYYMRGWSSPDKPEWKAA